MVYFSLSIIFSENCYLRSFNLQVKKKSLQVKNGSLKREHAPSPNSCVVDCVELSSDDSPVKFKSDVVDLVTDSDDTISPVKVNLTRLIDFKIDKHLFVVFHFKN